MLGSITSLNTDFVHILSKYVVPSDIYCISRTCKTLMNAIGHIYDMGTIVNSIVYDRPLMIMKLLTRDTNLDCITSVQDRKLVKILATKPIKNQDIKNCPSQLLLDSGYFATEGALSFCDSHVQLMRFTIKPFHVENMDLYFRSHIVHSNTSSILFDDGDTDTIIKYCEYTGMLKYFYNLVCKESEIVEFMTKNYETYPKLCKMLLHNVARSGYCFTKPMSRDLAAALWSLDKHYSMDIIPFDMIMELNKKTISIKLKTKLHRKCFRYQDYWKYLMSDKCKIVAINSYNMWLFLGYCTPDMLSELYEKKGKCWSTDEQKCAKTHMKRRMTHNIWVDGIYDVLVRANELGLTNMPDSTLWHYLSYPENEHIELCKIFTENTKFLLDRKIPLPDITNPRFKKLPIITREKIKDIIIRELLAKLA